MEIGLAAAGNGYIAQAEQIFRGIEAIQPESELPLIGRAVARLNAGRKLEAIKILQSAMEKNPDSDLAMSFLGFALHLAGMKQASRDALTQVVEANNCEEAVALAKSVLES